MVLISFTKEEKQTMIEALEYQTEINREVLEADELEKYSKLLDVVKHAPCR